MLEIVTGKRTSPFLGYIHKVEPSKAYSPIQFSDHGRKCKNSGNAHHHETALSEIMKINYWVHQIWPITAELRSLSEIPRVALTQVFVEHVFRARSMSLIFLNTKPDNFSIVCACLWFSPRPTWNCEMQCDPNMMYAWCPRTCSVVVVGVAFWDESVGHEC